MTANPTPSRPKRYAVSWCSLDFPDQSSPGQEKIIRAEGKEAEVPGRLSPARYFSRHAPTMRQNPSPAGPKRTEPGLGVWGGGVGTGEGAWQAGVSASGCRSILPPQLPPTPNTHITLSGTPISSPQRRQVDRDVGWGGSSLCPPPLAFGPFLGTRGERRAGVSDLGKLVLPCCLRTCVLASAPAYFP